MTIRVVLDTNVVFEGLTKQKSACGLLIDAWQAGLLIACISTSVILEYEDVLSRMLSPHRWQTTKPVLKKLLTQNTAFVTVFFSWRPLSPDPGDDHIIDCAMNSRAIVITANIKDFTAAQLQLGLPVMRPVELLDLLAK